MDEKTRCLDAARRGIHIDPRTGFAFLVAVLLASGCSPTIKFTRTECLYVPDRDGPGSVAFVSTFEARNLTNEQLVYHVTLERSGDRPVRAPGTQYRDKDGRVAANRSLMCMNSPWTFENTRVAIPVEQLGITPEDHSVTAVFSVDRADGTTLATDRLPLPLARVHRAMGNPSPAPPPPTGRATRQTRPRRQGPTSQPSSRRRSTRPRTAPASPPIAERSDAGIAPPQAPRTEAQPRATNDAAQSSSPEVRESARDTTTPSGKGSSAAAPVDRSQLRYVVRRGDTLSEIAKQTLGQASKWPVILEANRDQLQSPEDLREGMELIIPEGPD